MKLCAKVGNALHDVVIERQDGVYVVEIDGVEHVVDALKLEGDFYSILVEDRSYEVSVEPRKDGYYVRHRGAEQVVDFIDLARAALEPVGQDGPEQLVSAMPGKVVRILVSEGDEVQAGQGLVVVEAMKMENEIAASRDGRVTSIAVETGQTIEGGGLLAVIE